MSITTRRGVTFLLVMTYATIVTCSAQDQALQSTGEFEAEGIWRLQIELSEIERAAMEPAVPDGFGGQTPRRANPNAADRETVPNLMGMRFPWSQGQLHFDSAGIQGAAKCRLRYDGDFTYLLSAASPKRPMFLAMLDEANIQGSSSFRLHTMQFDPTMLRERITTFVFARLSVPVPRICFAEVQLKVGETEPVRIGLYAAKESVGEQFLKRNAISPAAFVMQTNGLGSLQYLGEEWTAYAPLFRANRAPTKSEQDRVIAFAKLLGSATDDELSAQIDSFVNVEALLRYTAAQAITSNLTGFSNIGTNDYICLDPDTGRFHFVASEIETALSGSVLAGTPEQLADLSVFHPYAGECKLIARILSSGKHNDHYRRILQNALREVFTFEGIDTQLKSIEEVTTEARAEEAKAIAARARQLASAFGGGGPAGGPQAPPAMDIRTFVKKRSESIERQLAGSHAGYVPAAPTFPAGGFGPPSRQGAPRPITPEQFNESVQVPDAFVATLYAKSPEVNYPVAISAEPSGAIYVASDEQGSLGTDKNGGKILRCVDKDNDGVMDSVTTYCRVDHVRGVVNRGGTVWVCHPPFLTVFNDDNADGVADRQQQLVRGLTTELVNTRGGDHSTNGIRMGIDGWIYIGDGDYGVPEAKGLDGSTVVLRGGGILRVRPDGTELELFCSGLRNPFDIAIDPQLNMFTRDNTNDGGGWDTRVSQLFQSAEYGYPRLFANFSDEIMPALGAFGGGGGTGSLFVQDDAWPNAFRSSLFTSDWGRSAVFHHPLKAVGPTFELTQEPFATVPRATGMDIDALGNLFVASWWSGEASVYVGPQVGFVTRIRPKTEIQRAFPSLNQCSLGELAALLGSSQSVVRFHVQGELLKRAGEEVVAELTRVVRDHQFPIDGRIVALFTLKQIEGAGSHALLIELTKDRALREFAIRALADRKSQLDRIDPKVFTPFLKDESARVRAQTLIALGRLGKTMVGDLIVPMAGNADLSLPDPAKPNANQVIPHLAQRTLIELKAVDACLRALAGDHWRSGLQVLRNMHTASAVDGLIARLGIERDQDRRTAILATLVRLYQKESPYDGSWWGIRPDTTGPFYDPQTWDQSPAIKAVLLTALRELEGESASKLRHELERHQLHFDDDSKIQAMPAEQTQSIVIEPVDPSNAKQIGNLNYEDVLTQVLAMKGNPEAGASVFKARSCNACHTSVAGQKPLGPHLADIGKRYKANELIESILKPNEKIAQGYETQRVLLDNGKIITGFIVSENGRQISLRDSQGKTHVIERNEIEQRAHQKVSAMPEGLAASLEVEILADLIAYLQSL